MDMEKLINKAGEINEISNSIIEAKEELEFINNELLTGVNSSYYIGILEEDREVAELTYFIQLNKLKKLLDKLN